jgi:hypothetical protein
MSSLIGHSAWFSINACVDSLALIVSVFSKGDLILRDQPRGNDLPAERAHAETAGNLVVPAINLHHIGSLSGFATNG